jgi:hypothetical protein
LNVFFRSPSVDFVREIRRIGLNRFFVANALLFNVLVWAKGPQVIEVFKTTPASTRALAQLYEKEKPGAWKTQLLWTLEARLREKGTPLDTPEDIDALTKLMFEKILSEMSAPTEVFSWSKDDAPRGELLLREKVKLFPGQNSSHFKESFVFSPKGKRIDRAFANTPLTVEVSVAKSEVDFYGTLESSSSYWAAGLHQVMVSENVARVVVQLFSPGRGDPPAAIHQRPIWLGLFRRASDMASWETVDFAPALSQFQKGQEANILPADGKEKLSDAMRQLILNLRMADVRYINPARKVLTAHELSFVLLVGLNGELPLDAKKMVWLEPYRIDENPLVRAVAILRLASLGGVVTGTELVSVLESVRALPVQVEANGALTKLLATAAMASEEDKKVLAKAETDEVRVLDGIAMVSAGGRQVFYKKVSERWKPVVPKQ